MAPAPALGLCAAAGGGCGEPALDLDSWSVVVQALLPHLLLAIVAAEVLFAVLLRRRAVRWRKPLDWHAGDFVPLSRPAEETLRRIEEHLCRSRRHAESFFTGWHFDCDMSSLARVDAEELLAWAVFARRKRELPERERGLLDKSLRRVEAKTGLCWGVSDADCQHRTSSPRFAAHTWQEDCKYHYFPLFLYVGIFLVHRLIDFPVLTLLGFRRGQKSGVGYWIKGEGKRTGQETQDAYVFLHGISVGRIFYLPFVLGFAHQTVMIIDMPWVAFNPFQTTVPKAADFSAGVADVLDFHGIHSICAMSHSYGSFVTAWLLHCPRLCGRVARTVLVSGPAMLLFHPKTCRAVCYDQPFWFEHSLAHIFFRQFFWYEYLLTAEDLPSGSLVVLSEHDEMIPVAEVISDCQNHKISHLVLPGLRHGFELFWPTSCRRIIKFILAQEPEPKQHRSLLGALWSSAGPF